MLKSKKMYILASGVVIALVQFLGIPGTWKSAIAVVLGSAVAILTVLVKRDEIRRVHSHSQGGDAYVENLPSTRVSTDQAAGAGKGAEHYARNP